MAVPTPSEVSPWYLRNITQALALNETTGQVYVRTDTQIDIGNANISIGNVGIESLGNVDITGNTLPVTIDNANIEVTQGTSPWVVSGTVTSTLSGNLAGITGNVTVVDGGGSITVDGTVNANITGGNVTATLSGNLPGITGNVTVVDGGGSLTVDGNVGITGNVNIGTMPNVNANVSGNVGVTSLGNIDLTANTLPVSGNVNANITGGNVTVSGNVGVSSFGNIDITGNALPITGNVNATLDSNANVIISGFSGQTADAFGRLRVSNPYTLFDTQNRYYDHEQYSSSLTGTANVVYQANSSSFMCNVGTTSGDSVLRETVRVFPYQPGKSLLILSSFCFNSPKPNLTQRTGFFDADNGVFFEAVGATLNMVIRSSSTGSIVEDRIPQSSWNGDPLDGTGPSGISLDVALIQIWYVDIEWLGVGSVRVGFIINGQYITCHTFNHANTPNTGTTDNTTTYMTTATLPLRCEITNTGTTGSPSMLRQICASVISEGGFQLSGSGNPRAASHLIGTPVRLPNDASFKPVIAIRLKSTMLDAVVVPINYTLVPVAQSLFQYRIYKYAVTSGGVWVDSAVDSAVQYNLAPTTLVSGDIVEQSFINSTNQSSGAPTQEIFTFTYQLEREPFTGTPYEYVIMMATTGTNQDVYASIEWQEMS